MELHQIRYFLSLSELLNFTQAAEACHVSQPALSRAIAQLEAELGGELFRRERKLTHLTDFGRAILPPLKECYEATLTAKELARHYHRDGHAPLSVALSRSIDIELLTPMLVELGGAFPHIEIKMFRGTAPEIVDRLKNGESEVAICGQLPDDWDRIEARRLYEQEYGILINRQHRLATKTEIELVDLSEARLLGAESCVLTETLQSKLRELGLPSAARHEVTLIDDIPSLVQANLGMGVWPTERSFYGDLLVCHIREYPMSRWVQVYTVFGREHSVAARTLIGLLRARDWSIAAQQPHRPAELVA